MEQEKTVWRAGINGKANGGINMTGRNGGGVPENDGNGRNSMKGQTRCLLGEGLYFMLRNETIGQQNPELARVKCFQVIRVRVYSRWMSPSSRYQV